MNALSFSAVTETQSLPLVILSVPLVILSASLVILSAAKDLLFFMHVENAR